MHHGGDVRGGQQTGAPEREADTEHTARGGQGHRVGEADTNSNEKSRPKLKDVLRPKR